MGNSDRIKYLLDRHLAKTITQEEKEALMELLQDPSMEERIKEIMSEDLWGNIDESEVPGSEQARQMLSNILKGNHQQPPVVKMSWYSRGRIIKWVAAAVVLLALVVLPYLYYTKPKKTGRPDLSNTDVAHFNDDVRAGGNKAFLTLADGSTVILEDVKNGYLTAQGGSTISKVESGQLAYKNENGENTEVVYNTLSVPRGGQYRIVLPDGSTVWLNAGSTLRFPTAFAGSERRVELKGEAYFEIAKKTQQPFYVAVEKTEVRVLGTHFNVKGYSDEDVVATTLLEGAVVVAAIDDKNSGIALLPGQLVHADKNGTIQGARKADLKQTVAWKNGRQVFNNETIQAIMQQVARWYDIEVDYIGAVQDRYSLDISREVPLSELLLFLEISAGVHFTIKDKKVTVRS